MRLLRNHWEYRNGKPYDPKTFKKPAKPAPVVRLIPRMDTLILDIMRDGFALIPASCRETIRTRMRRDNLHWSFRRIDPKTVKITPVKE